MRSFAALTLLALLVTLVSVRSSPDAGLSTVSVPDARKYEAQQQTHPALPTIAREQSPVGGVAAPFVANVGQWPHGARFVHRSGPMTVLLEDRGWVIDLVEHPVERDPRAHGPRSADAHRPTLGHQDVDRQIRGVALRMTFEGDAQVPELVGEGKLGGHHNYFLGDDETRWRTHVPLYESVRYRKLYSGIDVRVRQANGIIEYDLLLEPGADLLAVSVHVEGAQGLSIASDGSLVVDTVLGPLTQPAPKTWQTGEDGRQREVICDFTLLGPDRFGFAAPGWDGDTSLTIDPGLIWSTFLGGNAWDEAYAVSVDASGLVTVAGGTSSTNFPTTSGAYDTTYNGRSGSFFRTDAFVSRLDPSKTGSSQLIYSTFLGGLGFDYVAAMSVDAGGVVTVAGRTDATNFPTTRGAYDTTANGGRDAFVSRLDPSKAGSAQLVYSTYLGGGGHDEAAALAVDGRGVVTVVGETKSTNYPTTRGAYDTTYGGGGSFGFGDVLVSRLDPSKAGAAQLVYSTYLGGKSGEAADAVSVDAVGVMTVAGFTFSTDFPVTTGAFDTTYNGSWDVLVARLDPSKTGGAQLVYSTYLGGSVDDWAHALSVDSGGAVTVAGFTSSPNLPTTPGAYDRTFNGSDVFVSRLDPGKAGSAQLVYSTYLGGSRGVDESYALSVAASGVVTVVGRTGSWDFPTTSGAYDRTHNGPLYGNDVFVSRLDPRKTGTAQLVYSTYLGGSGHDYANALAVDAVGLVTVTGQAVSINYPTTTGAYDTTHNGGAPFYGDVFVSRLDMGVGFHANGYELSAKTGGTQKLTVNAGKAHANKSYWIFGSVSGTTPGLGLPGVHIPLNPDPYTVVAMAHVNSTVFTKFRGTLDANGLATAAFHVPANLPLPSGFMFHHAYIVYDANGTFYMASNSVPLEIK